MAESVSRAQEARQNLKGCTIWLWHYLHGDWQWTLARAWHETRYPFAVAEALDIMQRDPEFMYFIDSASEFFEPVQRRLGARFEEFKQRVAEGRIRITAQVTSCRPNQVGDETFLRNLQMGRAIFEAVLPPTDLSHFHNIDIGIGQSQLPQILTQAGYTHYRSGRPIGAMNARGIPQQFIWEGPDGSRILVTRGVNVGLFMSDHLPPDHTQDWDGVVAALFEEFFRDQLECDRSPSGQLAMVQGIDDGRPFRTGDDVYVDMPGIVAEWRRREQVPIHWCTPLEFGQAVAEHADKLQVVKGVLDACDCHYNLANGGSNGLWHWRQMNDRHLLRAECWAAAAASAGFPYPQEALQRLWREHLTYQAHASEFAFQEDFDHLVDMARDVQYQTSRIEQGALMALAQAAGGGDHTAQVVFNPHPWPVQADVELTHFCIVPGVESLQAVDEQGQPLPQQRLWEFRHGRNAGAINEQRRLVRVDLPPMGYRRLTILEKMGLETTQPAEPEKGVLEEAGLRLTYREHALREVHDLTSGTLYFSRDGSPWPNLTFHVLADGSWFSGGPELRRERFLPEKGEWLQMGPLRWQHRSRGKLGPFEAEIDTLVGGRERELQVRVHLEGHWHQAPIVGFATLLGDVGAGGKMAVDAPFGVESRDPDHELYVHNAPPHLMGERMRPGVFWARSWADWSEGKRGLTWISADGCYYWLKEAGSLGHILLRCQRAAQDDWEQRVGKHLSGTGEHHFTYALRFHDGDWRAGDPQRRSAELRHPPVAVRPDCPSQATLTSNSFLALKGPALLSAYYREGEIAVVRLYEYEGHGGEATLTADWEPAAARSVDLINRSLDVPVRVAGRQVTVGLKPWQIVTLQLERGRQP